LDGLNAPQTRGHVLHPANGKRSGNRNKQQGGLGEMKLFDADGEVHVGDVVRFNKKPCYVERIGELVTLVTMDERKLTLNVRPHQINCVVQKDAD
jgi:hypothetical protein